MIFSKKHFISLKDMTAEEILYVLSTADTMKYVLNQKNKKAPHLQGKSVFLVFEQKSTRSKLSYELAAQYLSANVVDLTASGWFNEYLTLVETGRVIDQMGGDFIILRHGMAGSAKLLSENVNASVINAGDGYNENPSQALVELMTIKNEKGGFDGLKVAIIGDLTNSRVTLSNIWGLMKLGAKVSVAGPPTLLHPHLDEFGVDVFFDPLEAVCDADVIMALRTRKEEDYGNKLPSLDEYKSIFKIDEETLKYAKKDAIIMHPGSIKRGIEISSKLIESKRCMVEDQISNGVAVRMALLYLLSLNVEEIK